MSKKELVDLLIRQIRRSGSKSAQPKALNTISSNISTGFKKAEGQDYKHFYEIDLRRSIASWGAYYGVPVSEIVDLVVAIRDYPVSEKRTIVDDISRALS